MAAAISSPYCGNSPHNPSERHQAGSFEHVAQMNMFDDNLPLFRILPKIRLMRLSAEEDPEVQGLGDRKIKAPVPAETASSNKEDGTRLLNVVRRDLQLSDSENSELGHPGSFSLEKTKKNKKNQPAKTKSQTEEEAVWAEAKVRVERFLDFPAVISAMAFRNQPEAGGSSHISPTDGRGQIAMRELAPIPNTRHNAIFLRDSRKTAQVILASQDRNGQSGLKTECKIVGKANPKEELHLKRVHVHPNSLVEEPKNNVNREQDSMMDR